MAFSGAEEFLRNFERELYNDNNWFVPHLVKAEQSTGIRRTYLAAGLLACLVMYLCIGRCAQFFCSAYGFGWPAYKTLKHLDKTSKDEDIKWMTYWVMFGFFSVIEFFSESLTNAIPPYFVLKALFVAWMQMPGPDNGAFMLYHKIIRPLFNNQVRGDAVGSAKSSISAATEVK